MKRKLTILIAGLLIGLSANATVYLKYSNKDSKKWKFEVKIGGSTRTVEFNSSTTGAVTIQGGGDDCEVKTECGWVKLEDDDKIEIKNGCITIK